MPALTFKERTIFQGCLAKVVEGEDRWSWKRHWVWLLPDRLCYASIANARKDVYYIPLDRITVRPLPRGYTPGIGIQHIDKSIVALPDPRLGTGISGQPQGRTFSVQYGARAAFWAASTSQEAEAWIQAIQNAWVNAVLHPDRHTSCCEALLQIDASGWRTASDRPAKDREELGSRISTAMHESVDQELLCDIEVHTREAKGWTVNAKPWIAVHSNYKGASSGRHLLVPIDGSAKPFSSAAVATCEIWVPAGLLHEISSVELGLHGECKLWAPEKVLLRPYGHTSWTVFPCDSILSNC